MSFLAFGIAIFATVLSPLTQDENPQQNTAAVPNDEATKPQEQAPATGFLYKTVEFQGTQYAYCVFIPPTYTEEQAWPVILALHGSGTVGDDGFLQTKEGISIAIRNNWKMFPAIVVMPQCRRGHWWQGEMLEMALKCVEDVSREYHCDQDRVYLTGLSMGGAGVWLLAARLPDAFAAVVPICGFWGHPFLPADANELAAAAKNLAKLPIWCFHGDADRNVPIERDREIIQAIESAGGQVKFTEIPGGQHNVWDNTYANPVLWKWLFAQKRGANSGATSK